MLSKDAHGCALCAHWCANWPAARVFLLLTWQAADGSDAQAARRSTRVVTTSTPKLKQEMLLHKIRSVLGWLQLDKAPAFDGAALPRNFMSRGRFNFK